MKPPSVEEILESYKIYQGKGTWMTFITLGHHLPQDNYLSLTPFTIPGFER